MMRGYWTIDVPVAPAEVDADQELLKQFEPPDGVLVKSAEVIVHGRIWYWREVGWINGDFGNGQPFLART